MRIGIVGSGRLGGTLGTAWGAMGHEIVYGARDPRDARLDPLLVDTPHARTATLQEAKDAAEVVLVALPGPVADEVVATLGPWHRTILIDASNDARPDGTSVAEALQRGARGARVVKAFNVIGVDALRRAAAGEATGTMPIAGNDDDAVAVASRLAADLGLTPLHVGGLAMAASLERLAGVWTAWSRTLGRRFLWDVVT
jgi:predicted dinucleotide-binding enzyme